MSGVLDQIAAEAVQKAIDKTADAMVGEQTQWIVRDWLCEEIRKRIMVMMKEPEFDAAIREKIRETIAAMPASLNPPRR